MVGEGGTLTWSGKLGRGRAGEGRVVVGKGVVWIVMEVVVLRELKVGSRSGKR